MNTEEKENIEQSNVEKTNDKKGSKVILIVLIIAIIAIISIGVGGYLLLFNEKKSDNTINDKNDNNTTDKNNKTKDDSNITDKDNSNEVVGFKYALIELDRSTYDFKVMKNSSTSDNITSNDVNDEFKEIKYNYEINDGNVIITNVTDNNTYTINGIKNAKELIAADIGQSPEFSGLFVLTTDGKLYSISLRNTAGVSSLIRDCSQFEDAIQSYDISAVSISQGSYYAPAFQGSGEGAILVTDNNNKQYVLKSHN